MPHLRVVAAVSTTTAAHAALQKPRECSTAVFSLAKCTLAIFTELGDGDNSLEKQENANDAGGKAD
jgi:hypothetical protein